MEQKATTLPFEASFTQIQAHVSDYVSAVFSSLESEFLVLPKGEGFIEYAIFEAGYETLKRATSGFTDVTPDPLFRVAFETPVTLIVMRTILGFTPPEWAYVATQHTGVAVSQGFARTLDRGVRMQPLKPLGAGAITAQRVRALTDVASQLIVEGAPRVRADQIHRLDKADTAGESEGLRGMAVMGVPYAMLLYERFLGRPFAGHRDSVSDLIGGNLETTIEDVLSNAGISYRKTKRAERIPGFDQTPDFIVPSEFNPRVVIEAKITEDDGTASDKVTRVQHLAALSLAGQSSDQPKFEVVACIGGRGFGVRREDMRKLLYATRGKVFTIKDMGKIVEYTRLKEFKSR